MSSDEIKEVFEKRPRFFEAKKQRIMAIGITKYGRILSIVLDKESSEKYFIVTARDASKRERKNYEEFEGGDKNK